MSLSTNLARRPFRNERLPWLLAILLILFAGAVSFAHTRQLVRLLSGDEANTVRVVREGEARVKELEAEIAREPALKIEAAELARLAAFKDLVDRRVFPWRRLLSELESVLSDDVRLTRIAPQSMRDARTMRIELEGQARSKDAAFSLAETLDGSPAFSNSTLRSLAEDGSETQFVLEVEFDAMAPQGPVLEEKKPDSGGAL